jgi:hypothetical protein
LVDEAFFELVRHHIPSVWALELILLMRSQPQRAWTAAELVAELRASRPLVRDNLKSFQNSGLVAAEAGERFRFTPAGALLQEFCDRLAETYKERPVAMINLIAAPPDKVQELADAFRFKSGPRLNRKDLP